MGGDMVRAVLQRLDPHVPLGRCARRAANTCAPSRSPLYAQGKVKHVGAGLSALEDELCDFGPDGFRTASSPDRLDALVWAVTALTARGREGAAHPQLRRRPAGAAVAARDVSVRPLGWRKGSQA